jgi:hypothetical protein
MLCTYPLNPFRLTAAIVVKYIHPPLSDLRRIFGRTLFTGNGAAASGTSLAGI